jgi:hypothetical protein
MPSRKVRRRRAKLQRHEYEYVLENDEGEEIVVESPRLDAQSDGKSKRAAEAPRDKAGREVPKPSMGRVMKRTAIFAPLILIVVFLTSGENATTTAKIYTTVMLLLFFIPFSYLVDVFMYRMLSRRQQRARSSKG